MIHLRIVLFAILVMHQVTYVLAEEPIGDFVARYLNAFNVTEIKQKAAKDRILVNLKNLKTVSDSETETVDRMVEILSVAGRGKEAREKAKNLKSFALVRSIWAGSSLVPPPSAGNNLHFMALQLISRDLDEEVLEWVDANYSNIPPHFLQEAKRRAINKDTKRATRYFFDSMMRFRFESLRCDDRSLGDLHRLWGGYSFKTVKENVTNEEFKLAYKEELINSISRWDDVLPVDLAKWQSCNITNEAIESGRTKLLKSIKNSARKFSEK